ncbi:MAG: signal peptidase II [Sphingomonadales bacterium]|jgi:signal peptidase II
MRLGLISAGIVLLLDQLSKYWILSVYDLPTKVSVEILPFFSLTMVWNKGISLGLFQAGSDVARWALIVITVLVTVFLLFWLAKASGVVLKTALGLVIGGAVGNIIDRVHLGAVADFVHLHGFGYSFYVFNVADAAITVGVSLLLLDAYLLSRDESKKSKE